MTGNTEDRDVEKRRDDALRRALTTPPKPKTNSKGDKRHPEKENGKEAKR